MQCSHSKSSPPIAALSTCSQSSSEYSHSRHSQDLLSHLLSPPHSLTHSLTCLLTKCALGSRECSASVLKMEVGDLPAIISRHSELSSQSMTGQTMPSRA